MKNIIKSLIVLCLSNISITNLAQDSLVGYWSFDNITNETFIDESNNNNTGTTIGSYSDLGIKGSALTFDGNNDYAKITADGINPPAVFKSLGKGTISVWFKVNHIPTDDGIAPILYYGSTYKCDFFDAANQGLIIEVGHSPVHYESERLYFTIWKDGCTYPSFCFDSNDAITTGEWYHFVAVVGEDFNTGYLNGQEMTNRRYNFGNSSYSQFFEDAVVHEEFWLGKGHWNRTTQFFNGQIDELKIFNEPLTASQILDLYNEVVVTSSNEFNHGKEQVYIYPNPATNILNLDLLQFNLKIEEVSLINTAGQKTIISSHIQNNQINLNDITPGIYNLVLKGTNEIINQKVLIIK